MSIVAAIKWWWLYPLSHELEVHQAIMRLFTPRLITSREEAAERSLDAFEIMSAKQFHAGKIRDVIENLRSQLGDTAARREKLEIEARSCREMETELSEIIAAYEQMQEKLG